MSPSDQNASSGDPSDPGALATPAAASEAPRLPVRASIYIDPDGTVHFGALFEGLVSVADALGNRRTTVEADPDEPAALDGSHGAGTDAIEAAPLDERARTAMSPVEGAPPQPALLDLLSPLLMRPVLFARRREPRELSAVRPRALGLDESFTPLPREGERDPLPAPIWIEPPPAETPRFTWAHGRARRPRLPTTGLPWLGVAQPAHFRIDEQGRVPTERDAPPPADEHPASSRRSYLPPRPPLTLPAAPLVHLDGTAFRFDPQTGALPNESIIEARPQPELPSWYSEAYDRDFYRRWTPMIDIWGLGPLQNEWFSYWWVEFREQKLGGFPYFPFREDREIKWLIILRCKEQMMIRRDVKKLETPPELSDFVYEIQGVGILQHERLLKLTGLIKKPTWIEIIRIQREDTPALHPWLDAYSDWRALMGGLEEQ